MLDSIRPEDPLGWLSDYLRDPTSDRWATQARAARQHRAESLSLSAAAGAEVSSVEYLGKLRPHLCAALRSLVDTRPKNAAMTLSDMFGGHRGEVPADNSGGTAEEPASAGDANSASVGADGDRVVE